MQKIGGNHWRLKWAILSIKLCKKPLSNLQEKEMLKEPPVKGRQKNPLVKRNKLSVPKDIA